MDPEKLNWMYAGPAGHVNPDEYLTGRAVDKTFEQFKLGGAEPIGLDLPPPTLPRNSKSSVPGFQVDVARKVQEDPLLRIKLKAEERKAELMEQMLIKRRLAVQSQKKSKQHEEETQTAKKGKEKKKKKKKKKKKRDSDSEDSESSDSDLDAKLARKMIYLKQEKEDLDTQIANKLKKLKGQKKRSSSSSSSSSSASVSSSSESDNTKSSVPKKRYRSISPKKADEGATAKRYSDRSPRDRDKHRYDREPMDYRRPRNDRRRSRSPHQKEWRKRPYEDRDRNRDRDRDKGRERERARDVEKERDKRRSSPEQSRPQERTGRPGPPAFQRRPAAPKLSEEELEKRRREMMQDAVVRDNERKDRVEQYKKEAAAEDDQLNDNRPKEAAFVRNQLARAASSSTVESRIKSNVFNIQRSGASMDSNFARR